MRRKINISWNDEDILMEAPEDTGAGDDDLQASDYGDMEEVDIGDSEDLGAEDYSETAENSEEEPTEGEDDLNTEGEDSIGDETPVDGEDATAEDGEVTDENPETEQPDNNAGQKQDYEKNEYLINDFIELYNRLGNMIEKINNDQTVKNMRNPILTQAKHNMDDMYDVLYVYITDRFNKENYITNLYQFNLIMQALNLNLELLEKGVHPELGKKKRGKK